MENWKHLVKNSITKSEDLAHLVDLENEDIDRVHKKFPFCINPYYFSLIKKKDDALWKQVIPDKKELDNTGIDDPLNEEHHSPVRGITHRYPDRVLFYVSHVCAVYCRFCTRKRKVGNPESLSKDGIEKGLEYIRNHKEIRDVIVSGGDPLMLPDTRIDFILKNLRAIKHIEMIRIGTRVPVTLPQRITKELCAILKQYHPLYINTHFNHPNEITPESAKACSMLADSGIPLGNQSVLLKGVNDTPEIMIQLVQKLLNIRVRPYYLYQMDLVKGTDHFRTSIQRGLDIIQALRGFTSGLAVPQFVIDAPGGGGKITLMPNSIVSFNDSEIVLKNYEGDIYHYPTMGYQNKKCNPHGVSRCTD